MIAYSDAYKRRLAMPRMVVQILDINASGLIAVCGHEVWKALSLLRRHRPFLCPVDLSNPYSGKVRIDLTMPPDAVRAVNAADPDAPASGSQMA